VSAYCIDERDDGYEFITSLCLSFLKDKIILFSKPSLSMLLCTVKCALLYIIWSGYQNLGFYISPFGVQPSSNAPWSI
jgi:hypothetical protein